MSPSLLSLLFFLLSLLSTISSTGATLSISLSLHHFNHKPSPHQWQRLAFMASASVLRAHHLKKPKNTPNWVSKTPLFPHSYGGYSISVKFGTPAQEVSLLVDTGSDLVWFPCTENYVCKNCTFADHKSQITSFVPKSSSSSKLIGCKNPKCSWIHSPEFLSTCQKCPPNSTTCSQVCPPYTVLYGSGSTAGLLLSETLILPAKSVPNFAVGCSLFSQRQPAGISGFGRGRTSLPSQLGLKRFSYCLVSHNFDDTSKSSTLILDGGSDSGEQKNTRYTPFLKNPTVEGSAFSVYYYVMLRKVTVGGKHVKIPYRYLKPGSDGNGGTVVDSGTTFSFMEGPVFEPIVNEILKQVGQHYKRAADVESHTGLRPCFNIPDGKVTLPELGFHFKGGAEMKLPLANYFSLLGNTGAICLTIVTNGVLDADFSGGPSIILGNFQQQNFYVEYDLGNERFGFRQQKC